MDWVIGTLILAGVAGAVKIIKDIWDKKPVNLVFVIVEIVIICGTLLFGMFARQSQKENEAKNRSDINVRMDSGTLHTDTSIAGSTNAIQDSADARERRMEDSIRFYRNQVAKNVRPIVDILPLSDKYNPSIENIGVDTFRVRVNSQNIGSASALDVHTQFNALFLENGNWHYLMQFLKMKYYGGEMPPVSNYVKQDRITLGYRFDSNGNNKLFVVCIFCYKDSTRKCFGPTVRIFSWKYQHFDVEPDLPSEDEYNGVVRTLKFLNRWPTSCF